MMSPCVNSAAFGARVVPAAGLFSVTKLEIASDGALKRVDEFEAFWSIL
jgi:hypothetical protein